MALPTTRIEQLTGYSRVTIRRHLIERGLYRPRSVGRPNLDDEVDIEIFMEDLQRRPQQAVRKKAGQQKGVF